MLTSFVADIRQSARSLFRYPGFMLAVLLTLSVGIGLNVAIFSVVNAVLLRPLPFPASERLVSLARSYPGGLHGPASVPKFLHWRERANLLEDVSAYDFAGGGLNLTGGDTPEQVRGIRVSIDFFKAFGASTAPGRTFASEEDTPRGPRAAVLSDGLWRRRFGADPGIVGRRITLGEDTYTVVGVVRPDFHPDPPADVWLPLQADPGTTNKGHFLRVVARLRPGVTLEAANEQLRAAGEEFRRLHPDAMGGSETVRAYSMLDETVGDARRALVVLSGAVGFVLLIACANVASLLLARATARQREIAIRAAIGASRMRLVRHLLVESLILAGASAAAGTLLGCWGVRSLLAISPGDIPRVAQLVASSPLRAALDWSVLAFAATVSAVTVVFFGIVPALAVSKPDLRSELAGTHPRGGIRPSHLRTRWLLTVGDVSLALVLVAGATQLVRSLMALDQVDPGVAVRNVLTLQVSLAGEKYSTARATERYEREVTRRIESLPGVVAAAQTLILPLQNDMDMPFVIEGRPLSGGERFHGDEFWRYIGPHYFKVFDIPLRRGRLLEDRDNDTAPPVAIVNEALADKYWPEGDALGQRITVGKGMGELEDLPREIVGVVRNTREGGVQRPVRPVLYVPEAQLPDSYMRFGHSVVPLTWAVRTVGDPRLLSGAVRRELLAADDRIPPSGFRTMQDVLAETTSRQRFNTLLLTIFAGVALLLACVGVYGSMACRVASRTREFGIRIALGADAPVILRSVVRHAAVLAGAGVMLGTAGALALTRVTASLVPGVTTSDVVSLALTAAVLAVVTLLAAYLPARRASRVDPMAALRHD